MTIADKLEKITRTFLAQQHGAIAEALKEQAKELSKRNDALMQKEAKKAQTAILLEQHKTDVEVVNFVESQAATQNTAVDKYLATMPEAFRLMYKTAAEKVKPLIAEAEQKASPLEFDLCISATDSKVFLYIPVLWEERQKPVLPGTIYTSSVIAMTQIAKDLKGKQDEPRPINEVVMQLVSDVDAERGARMLEDLLWGTATRGRELEGYEFRINSSLLRQRSDQVKTGKRTTPDIMTAQTREKTYTLEEAASAWREHEVQNGTVNGDEGNYKMKMGMRIKEGRVLTTDKGIAQGALDDFIKYCDVKKGLCKASQQQKKCDREGARNLMMMDQDALDRYTASGELFERNGEITVDAMIRFTIKHNIRDGIWVEFQTQLPRKIRKAEQEIIKPREEYITTKEAGELVGKDPVGILKLAKQGAFKTYYHGPVRTHFLFDREEITDYFENRK